MGQVALEIKKVCWLHSCNSLLECYVLQNTLSLFLDDYKNVPNFVTSSLSNWTLISGKLCNYGSRFQRVNFWSFLGTFIVVTFIRIILLIWKYKSTKQATFLSRLVIETRIITTKNNTQYDQIKKFSYLSYVLICTG